MGNGTPAGTSSSDAYAEPEDRSQESVTSGIKAENAAAAAPTASQNNPSAIEDGDAPATANTSVATEDTADEPTDEGKPAISELMGEW